ncbi:MAG: ParA family protein [Polyangiales bacterium]
MQEVSEHSCAQCSRRFSACFSYQSEVVDGTAYRFCTPTCRQNWLAERGDCVCSVCAKPFRLEYPFQITTRRGQRTHYCSTRCVAQARQARAAARTPAHRPSRIAVFNHKGGTGKTTTAINLAAALAEEGKRVLLVDADGQGNVGVSLGVHGEGSLYHVLAQNVAPSEVAVPVRDRLSVITANELLAAAELFLVTRPQRDKELRHRLGQCDDAYDVVVVDCAPALSLLNQNALVYCDGVLVPVACDYLSLVGMRQVLRTMHQVRRLLHHPVSLLGVLPTFFDARQRLARESLGTLQENFGERCLSPIRVNARLKEAPSVRQTIFEYAPDSHGAQDYRQLATRVTEQLQELQRGSTPTAAVTGTRAQTARANPPAPAAALTGAL